MCALRADLRVDSIGGYVGLFAPGGPLANGPLQWYRGDGLMRIPDAAVAVDCPTPITTSERMADFPALSAKRRSIFAAQKPLAVGLDAVHAPLRRKTRLLDWTESPLVALYFAVEKISRDKDVGVVWCLDPLALNTHAGLESRIYFGGIDPELDAYLPASVKAAPTRNENQPVALIAHRSFQRLIAQQGVFTIMHRSKISLEEIDKGRLLARVRIPAKAKARIRTSLAALGVDRLSLYPELQSVTGGG